MYNNYNLFNWHSPNNLSWSTDLYCVHCIFSPKDKATLCRLEWRSVPDCSLLIPLSTCAGGSPPPGTVGSKMSPRPSWPWTVLCLAPKTAANSSWPWLSNGFVLPLLLLKPVNVHRNKNCDVFKQVWESCHTSSRTLSSSIIWFQDYSTMNRLGWFAECWWIGLKMLVQICEYHKLLSQLVCHTLW